MTQVKSIFALRSSDKRSILQRITKPDTGVFCRILILNLLYHCKQVSIMKFFLILFLLVSNSILGQNTRANWILGFNEKYYEDQRHPILMNMSRTDTVFTAIDRDINFESTMASLSDTSGRLIAFTNGCAIYGPDFEVIENGDGINPGAVYDLSCPQYGYLLPDAAMFLPVSSQVQQFYLLHLTASDDLSFRIQSERLLYSVIERNGNSTKVTEKNIPISNFPVEGFAVTKHGNGRDWWIVVAERRTNTYHIYLLQPEGIRLVKVQSLGPPMSDISCAFSGNILFSPDGTTLARSTVHCGLVILDFDRCSGRLSKARYLPEIYTDYKHIDVAFSPDSKSLFILNPGLVVYIRLYQRLLFRLDLNKIGTNISPLHQQYLPLGVAPERISILDDSTMILTETNSKPVFHLITDANNKTDTIFFHPNAVKLPVLNMRTLPYFPNYALGPLENSFCDSLTGTFSSPSISMQWRISPNPVLDHLTLHPSVNSSEKYHVEIYNTEGKKVLAFDIYASVPTTPVDVQALPSGTYIIHIFNINNSVHHTFLKL